MKMMAWLIRYRNLVLLGLLLMMMMVSAFRAGREEKAGMVSLPVIYTGDEKMNAGLEGYRERRDEQAVHDMAVLQALCDNELLSEAARADAAEALVTMTRERKGQLALEGALMETALAPCVVVCQGECVSVITEKENADEGERALVLTLAQAHTGVTPGNVRLICGAGSDRETR